MTYRPEKPFYSIKSRFDFPSAVSGVITLEDNATYFLEKNIDLEGDRLVAGQNTTILGASSENCILSSTGLTGSALLSSAWTLPLRHFSITANIAINLDATGNANQALDWYGVNFLNCPTVGTIKNYNNFIYFSGALLNSANWTFDGTIDTVAFNQSLFLGLAGQASIIAPSTLTIGRRFRAIYSSFVCPATSTGVSFSNTATVPTQGYILDTVNFSGDGTYVTGPDYLDNKTLFVNSVGIENSREVSQYYMNGNATVTTIATAGVAVKAAGATTSSGLTTKFTNTANRATYTGAITRTFRVIATCSLSTGNNQLIGSYIAKNGVIIPESEIYITSTGSGDILNGTVQALVSLSTDDYIEFWVENDTAATNITVTDLNVIIE